MPENISGRMRDALVAKLTVLIENSGSDVITSVRSKRDIRGDTTASRSAVKSVLKELIKRVELGESRDSIKTHLFQSVQLPLGVVFSILDELSPHLVGDEECKEDYHVRLEKCY